MGLTKVTMGLLSGLTAKVLDIMKDHSNINLGEAKAATGTFVDFMIPLGVKRVTVMFDGVSTNGTSPLIIQLGTSNSAFQATGYKGQANNVGGKTAMSNGFVVASAVVAAETYHGSVCIERLSNNTLVERGAVMQNTAASNGTFSGGSVTLFDPLDRIRIRAANGTDQFDAGTINVSWEF